MNNHIKAIIIFIFVSNSLLAQSIFENTDTINFPYDKWTSKIINQANTAKDISYLTKEEKDIIWLTNLCRLQPRLFAKTFAAEYIKKIHSEKNKYSKSLLRELKKQKKLAAFKPSKKLYKTAKSHAIWSGKRGKTGHKNFNKRRIQSGFGYFAENCSYGYSSAIEIFMDLLIDRDIPNVGHRKNFLSKDTKFIGVSIQAHRDYEWNCVIDFGG